MSIFDTATSEVESPEIGQEETTPAEQQNLEGTDNQSETDPETEQEAEESSPEQGQEEEPEVVPASTHKELRSAFTRKAQEAAELRRQIEAMQGQRQAPPIPGQGQPKEPQTMAEFQQMINEQSAQMREEGYHEAFISAKVEAATANFKASMLEKRLDAQETQKENNRINADIDSMIPDYPDLATNEGFYMFANKVQEIRDDLGAQKITTRILKMAAKEIWGEDNKAKLYQSAKAKGKQEALDNIKAKQGVNTVISKKPNEQPKSLEEQLADQIMGAGRSGGIFG